MAFGFGKKKQEGPDILPILPSDIYETGALELKDVIAPSALKIGSKHLAIGEKFSRTFFVISFPRVLADNWFGPIINLDRIFDVSIFIHPTDTASVLRELQKKVTEIQSQLSVASQKGLVRDPKLDTAYRDIEQLRDQLQQSQERLFDVGLYITLYADSEDELDKTESEIKAVLESKLIYVKPALFQQEDGFKSTIPTGKDKLAVTNKLNTSPLSSLFPFTSFDLTSDKGILFGINRHNSSLVLFDRFSLENYNSVVFAKAGSGKSVRGNEPVLVRENGVVRLEQIGKIVERAIRKRGLERIDRELEGVSVPGFEVYSFNAGLRGSWSPVSVAARKDAPAEYFTFVTKSGREITTTPDHNMLVLRDGAITVTESADVRVGETVPLPRSVALSQTPIHSINLLTLLRSHRNMYVVGAKNIISEHKDVLSRSNIDARLDAYREKYARGRRVPLRYFLKILAAINRAPDDDLARSLRISSATGKASLPALMPITKDLGTILGFVASEGTCTDSVVIISNYDQAVLSSVESAFEGLGVSHFRGQGGIATSDRPFIALLKNLGAYGKSATKRVPGILFGAPREIIAAFLSAYFEGDGGIDGAAITALSKSRGIISDIAYLLFFFGIVGRVHTKKKTYTATGRKRTFWQISLSSQSNLRKFAQSVGFLTDRKSRALATITTQTENTNTDVIPEVAPLLEEIYRVFGSQLHDFPAYHELRSGRRNPSPERLARVIAETETRVNRFKRISPVISAFESLPDVEHLVRMGESNREYNRLLWEKLGSSWAWIKKREGAVGFRNACTVADVVLGADESKEMMRAAARLHGGFLTLDVPLSAHSRGLGKALRAGVPDRTSYAMIREASACVASMYRSVLENIPHIEGVLGMLKRLAEADLYFDPIVSINKRGNTSDRYVYDLTVDNEVFLAGRNGVFVHNSYATKLEIVRTLMFDTEVIVIDPEREYEYLAEAVGGRYFNISLTSEHHINPFDVPPVGEDESPADILRSNIIALVGLFRIMLGGLTPEEDAVLDRAITETYALKDITPDQDFSGKPVPLLSDLELVLAGMDGGDSLAQRLAKYTRGTWAGFINRPTNVDINKKFIVFSVRDMEDELKPVAMHIVTHYIWNAVRKNLRRRLLVIDEAWWMMKSEDTASFIFSLAKRGRKYYLGLATITQDVQDFLKSPYGLPIITNSSIQVLLKQSPAAIDVVQKTFNLTDEEKYLLLESEVGEGIFFAGLKHVAIKIIASYAEDQLITSDPSQVLAIRKAKKELGE